MFSGSVEGLFTPLMFVKQAYILNYSWSWDNFFLKIEVEFFFFFFRFNELTTFADHIFLFVNSWHADRFGFVCADFLWCDAYITVKKKKSAI